MSQFATFGRASFPAAVLLCLLAGSSQALAPIAHYPLQSDNLDATGLNGPITLTNAPFKNGGVYCNGIYPGHDPVNGYEVATPNLTQLNFDSFAVSIEFMMQEYPAPADVRRPILICGTDYRYLGAEVYANGTIALHHGNGGSQTSSQVVGLDSWHHVLVTYDAVSHTGKLFLDGLFVTSADFTLQHSTDRDVRTEHLGEARAFKGWIRHLVAYDSAFDPTPVEPGTWGRVKALYR